MSTDWEKYASAVDTRNRGRRPAENGVLSLPVGGVRSLAQTVEHAPTEANRAHTEVIGEKSDEVRVKLRRIAVWQIRGDPRS